MAIGRRELLVGAMLAPIVPLVASEPPHNRVPYPTAPLKVIAAKKNIWFGSEIHASSGAEPSSMQSSGYRQLAANQCSAIVPGNELKWNRVERQRGVRTYGPADLIMNFAQQSGLRVRGHNLLWLKQGFLPTWIDSMDFGSQPATTAASLISEHIDALCARYGRRIFSWDVVNEAVDEITGELRVTSLSKAMGSEEAVLDHAFKTVHAAEPGAQLVYNDYMSWDASSAKHRAGVLRLLEGFKRRGVPVHALGLQSHLGAGSGWSELNSRQATWRSFLSEVTSMGYELAITELDVDDRWVIGGVARRDQAVSDVISAFCEVSLSFEQLNTLMTWGLSDQYSWLQWKSRRLDLQPKRPCLYDSDYNPKLARGALARAMAGAPPRAAMPYFT